MVTGHGTKRLPSCVGRFRLGKPQLPGYAHPSVSLRSGPCVHHGSPRCPGWSQDPPPAGGPAGAFRLHSGPLPRQTSVLERTACFQLLILSEDEAHRRHLRPVHPPVSGTKYRRPGAETLGTTRLSAMQAESRPRGAGPLICSVPPDPGSGGLHGPRLVETSLHLCPCRHLASVPVHVCVCG